jgi:hypothetical protein
MSLQFSLPADYFLVMPKIRNGRRSAGFRRGFGAFVASSAMALGSACDERERLTFSAPDDGVGPVTTIDQPTGPDTTVLPGSNFFVNGSTFDRDGIDTVYFLVTGTNQHFDPVSPFSHETSVRFGVPLMTAGQSGNTFQIEVYGVDVLGNRGSSTTRQIHIQ